MVSDQFRTAVAKIFEQGEPHEQALIKACQNEIFHPDHDLEPDHDDQVRHGVEIGLMVGKFVSGSEQTPEGFIERFQKEVLNPETE